MVFEYAIPKHACFCTRSQGIPLGLTLCEDGTQAAAFNLCLNTQGIALVQINYWFLRAYFVN